MEEHGWPALLACEYAPLWLDDRSLEHIAGLAFSVEESDRERALAALRGWGPAALQAQALLEALVHDPIRTSSLEGLQMLLDQNVHLSVSTLQFALLHAGGRCRIAAMRQLLGDIPDWSEAHGLASEGVVNSLAQQSVLVLSLELWGEDWGGPGPPASEPTWTLRP